MLWGVLDESLSVAALHKLRDHIGLAFMISQVEDGDNVGVGAQASHGLGLAGDAGPGGVVQPLGLDKGEGYFSVQ